MKLGYTILYVDKVADSIKIYESAFGLKCRFLHESGLYGEMETGETTLAFADRQASKPQSVELLATSGSRATFPIEIAFTTKNVSDSFKKAVDAGCRIIAEPQEKPWGQIVSYVIDPNNFLIEICSPMS